MLERHAGKCNGSLICDNIGILCLYCEFDPAIDGLDLYHLTCQSCPYQWIWYAKTGG